MGIQRYLLEARANCFPQNHLLGRDKSTLPACDALLDEIHRAARGEWAIFGHPMRVDVTAMDWSRHPFTGVRAGQEHWSRIRYTAGIGGGDVKFVWELNRHRWLLRLAQGYFLTGDEKLAEEMLVLLDRWIDQNPPGRGINWTSSLEVAFRAISWCWIWNLTCSSPSWTDARSGRFLVALWHHARHVERFDSIHHSPNTHLTGEGLALLYVGLSFPELLRSKRWVNRGSEILQSELEVQVFDDGMHFERSVGYHRYTTEFYLHYLLLADAFRLAVDDQLRQRVHDQIEAAFLLRRPDGTWPLIGDEDSGSTLPLSPIEPEDNATLLALGGAYFRDNRWTAAAPSAARSAGWWLLDDDSWLRLHEAPPSQHGSAGVRSGALESAGYFVGRENAGPDSWWCLVDGGPHGGEATGHAHTDLGHVEIARGGTHIIADTGCAAYTVDRELRDWARSEHAHACLVIEGAPLAEPNGPFSWRRFSPSPRSTWAETADVWWCQVEYERAHQRGRLHHVRQVVLVRGYGLIVADWIAGDAPHQLAFHWPLAQPSNRVAIHGDHLDIEGQRMTWLAPSEPNLDASLQPAVRSRGYGRRHDGMLLRLQCISPSLPLTVVTCFATIGMSVSLRRFDRELGLEVPRQDRAALSLSLSTGASSVTWAPLGTQPSGVPG